MRFGPVAKAPRFLPAVLTALFVAALCGCASGPGRAPAIDSDAARGTDGPGADPPADLAGRPDAEPRIEPIRSGGANKPYQVAGRSYVPQTRDVPFRERGLASWYGRKFQGRMTSSGEPYDMYAMTAAHPTLPIPSYARIRNPANGREVLVRINDRGPFVPGRIVDLSYTAALKLDLLRGVAPVELERITFEDIRTGGWRRGGSGGPGDTVDPAPAALAAATAQPPAVAVAPAAAPPAVPLPTPTAVATTTSVPSQDVALVATTPPAAEAGRGFWVQLGAFRQRDGAESFRRRVGADAEAGWLAPLLTIVADSALYRVQAGPYRSRDEAENAAQRARASLAIVPVVVERQ
ncbi:MAG TPA: septal ring lytic transglycosylase RlpA family protein [Caldimonas sp.]|jgi:rare lipoprotein A|nr:septal ring lytic transglycosylase RlpA family protein [Caldimonas sp.]HEX4234389.1 septal ring lytic transglycosylase RlpA family protein [Caldimonas sp.]